MNNKLKKLFSSKYHLRELEHLSEDLPRELDTPGLKEMEFQCNRSIKYMRQKERPL